MRRILAEICQEYFNETGDNHFLGLKYIQWLEAKLIEHRQVKNNVALDSISIGYIAKVLKTTLEGNDSVRVEFDNEQDNINYVLDVVGMFKKNLEKDSL